MKKEKLYNQACKFYNDENYFESITKMRLLHDRYSCTDHTLVCYLAYKLFEENIFDESFTWCMSVLERDQQLLKPEVLSLFSSMNKTIQDPSVDIDVEFDNLKNYIISNVYYDESSSGIGDFMRGCCYLYEKLSAHKIQFEIDFSNHQIGNYIRSNKRRKHKEIFDTERENKDKTGPSTYFDNMKQNLNNILNVPKKSAWLVRKKLISIFSNYSDFIFMSDDEKVNYKLPDSTKKFMKKNIIFNTPILQAYNDLKLEDYVVAHFRLGDFKILEDNKINVKEIDDENINTKEFNTNYDDCLDYVVKIAIETKKRVVLLSDSNSLKEFVRDNIPSRYKDRVLIIHYDSFHCSNNPGFLGNVISSKDKKQKMFYVALDLKICTEAKHIYSQSVYPWGSGFTYWVSKIFDIPLTCEMIKDE